MGFSARHGVVCAAVQPSFTRKCKLPQRYLVHAWFRSWRSAFRSARPPRRRARHRMHVRRQGNARRQVTKPILDDLDVLPGIPGAAAAGASAPWAPSERRPAPGTRTAARAGTRAACLPAALVSWARSSVTSSGRCAAIATSPSRRVVSSHAPPGSRCLFSVIRSACGRSRSACELPASLSMLRPVRTVGG